MPKTKLPSPQWFFDEIKDIQNNYLTQIRETKSREELREVFSRCVFDLVSASTHCCLELSEQIEEPTQSLDDRAKWGARSGLCLFVSGHIKFYEIREEEDQSFEEVITEAEDYFLKLMEYLHKS